MASLRILPGGLAVVGGRLWETRSVFQGVWEGAGGRVGAQLSTPRQTATAGPITCGKPGAVEVRPLWSPRFWDSGVSWRVGGCVGACVRSPWTTGRGREFGATGAIVQPAEGPPRCG